MIRVGIAGCGSIARFRHAPEYAGNENGEIVGFYDYFPQRAEEMASQFGGEVYPNFEDMLADARIDAVSICTANKFHSSMTVQALEAGKHVLCEKPMALSIDEAKAMTEAARRNGKKLMIGHNQRLVPAHQLAKKLLQDRVIGKPLTFSAVFSHSGPETWGIDKNKGTWFFKKDDAGFGSLADLGVHKVDLMRWLIGSEVTEVCSVLTTLDKQDESGSLIQVDDNSFSILKMESGAVGTVTTGWTNYGEENNSAVIYGTEGVMEILADPNYAVRVILKNGEKINYEVGAIQTNTHQTNSGVIDLFIKCLEEDMEPAITGEDALQVMNIVFHLEESAMKKKMVKVETIQ